MTLFSSRLLSKSRSMVDVVFFLAPASPGSVCFFSLSLSLAIIGFEIREDFTILKTFPFFWPTQSHGKWKHFKTSRKHVNISSEPSQAYFKNIFRTSCEMIELLHGRDFWTFHVCFISYLFFFYPLSFSSYVLSYLLPNAALHVTMNNDTSLASCLFTAVQKHASVTKAEQRTAPVSPPRTLEGGGGRQQQTHAERERRADQESNMCCEWGGKYTLGGGERKHKQTGIDISLELRTGRHDASPRDQYLTRQSRFALLSRLFVSVV